jgi:hypothetical protein
MKPWGYFVSANLHFLSRDGSQSTLGAAAKPLSTILNGFSIFVTFANGWV